jgi:hypothetical protein
MKIATAALLLFLASAAAAECRYILICRAGEPCEYILVCD